MEGYISGIHACQFKLMTLSLISISSAIMGALGAWSIAKFGRSVRLVDVPNERSSHCTVTPKGGGVGIAGAFVVAACTAGLSTLMWLPLLVMAGLALLSDRIELSPNVRLPSQLLLAGLLVIGIWKASLLPMITRPSTPVIALGVFWVVFIVGTANFYNFMDGINGIAGLTGVIGFGLLGWYLELAGTELPSIIVAEAVSLACLGFLPFNMPKARVFMGDVGSILLGATFAALIYLESNTVLDFLCMVSFLFPFYADELTTMAVRIKDRENLLKPHRRHLYQLLANEQSIPHWKISTGYGIFQLVVGLSMLVAEPHGIQVVLPLLFAFFIAFIYVSFLVRKKLTNANQQPT
jgi:Fuc2NAc and GlcNAc transferase